MSGLWSTPDHAARVAAGEGDRDRRRAGGDVGDDGAPRWPAAGATASIMRSCQRAVLAEREQLRPAVVVGGDAREEASGRALAVRDGGHAQYHRTRVVDPARPGGARPRRGRSRRPLLRADDEAVLRGRAAFETMRVYAGVPFRSACTSRRLAELGARARAAGARHGRRSAAWWARRWRRSVAPDAVLRVVWTPGAGGDGPIGFVLVTPLPDGLRRDAGRAGSQLASLQLAIGAIDQACTRPGSCPASSRRAMQSTWLPRTRPAAAARTTRSSSRSRASRSSARRRTSGSSRTATLLTPALELGILAGVTRETLLAAAGRRGPAARRGGRRTRASGCRPPPRCSPRRACAR